MSRNKRIIVDGGSRLEHAPFAELSHAGLPFDRDHPAGAEPGRPAAAAPPQVPVRKNRGRVDIIRQTAHRGGKTVTVISGFVGIGLQEKATLAKAMQKACGTGGTVKQGRIEIQGDKRTQVARILSEAGFRPVLAGG